MITQDQITTIANRHQTLELNIGREYLQHLFLSYFYQQPQTSTVFFKGGTALRIIYHSPRFSEDLDFGSTLQDHKLLEQAIVQTLEAIEREGIATNLQEAKKTSGGYLSIITFQVRDQITSIRLEISLRGINNTGEIITIASDFLPPYPIMALRQDQLIDEKIQALLTRRKPRDFYDLYFILRSRLLPPQKKNILSQVLKILEHSDINFETELKHFLPKSHWAVIRDLKHILEREIRSTS